MSSKLRVVALASALALGGTAVQAQSQFDGFYVGVGAGAGNTSFNLPGATTMPSATGAFLNGVVGANFSSGGVLFGTEASLSFGYMRGTADCSNTDWTCRSNHRYTAAFAARVGLVMDQTLIFARAGIATSRITLSTTEKLTGDVYPDTVNVPGILLGAGLEYRMMRTQAIRVDLTHIHHMRRTWDLYIPYTARARTTSLSANWVFAF